MGLNSLITYAESGDAFCTGRNRAPFSSLSAKSAVHEASKACEGVNVSL